MHSNECMHGSRMHNLTNTRGTKYIKQAGLVASWNISDANQLLRANYRNFNLDHRINIQGEGRREVGFAKV